MAAEGGHGHAKTRAPSARSAVSGPARPMSETGPGTGGGNARESPREADGRSGDERPLPWLLRQKIAVPEPGGRLSRSRAGLVERAMPTCRRLTVLQAPGGFGKTTLLAECCRRLRDDGVPVAWVSVDEQDEPDVLDTYIAHACQSAAEGGIAGVGEPRDIGFWGKGGGGSGEPYRALRRARLRISTGHSCWCSTSWNGSRIRARRRCWEFLLKRGPRQPAPGLCVPPVAHRRERRRRGAGRPQAAILSTDELRFCRSEVADFFGGKLSRPQLAALVSESAGWPFALRISRNEIESGERGNARRFARVR